MSGGVFTPPSKGWFPGNRFTPDGWSGGWSGASTSTGFAETDLADMLDLAEFPETGVRGRGVAPIAGLPTFRPYRYGQSDPRLRPAV